MEIVQESSRVKSNYIYIFYVHKVYVYILCMYVCLKLLGKWWFHKHISKRPNWEYWKSDLKLWTKNFINTWKIVSINVKNSKLLGIICYRSCYSDSTVTCFARTSVCIRVYTLVMGHNYIRIYRYVLLITFICSSLLDFSKRQPDSMAMCSPRGPLPCYCIVPAL